MSINQANKQLSKAGWRNYLTDDLILHLRAGFLLFHFIVQLVVGVHRGILLQGLLLLLLYLCARNTRNTIRTKGGRQGGKNYLMYWHEIGGEAYARAGGWSRLYLLEGALLGRLAEDFFLHVVVVIVGEGRQGPRRRRRLA